ncbi:FAD-dependent oxidoreductase [Mesorhizobium sp. NBSH29]|uniref:FAD-dependent oxidoreductase n=1 Tax=Mesorhizobium sp. NBSH29 TaxID=2654249 RepID=UPI0018965CC5|nr:FAD-dependent oxidoreductase [Mesorhizobium sp. NBSH29]QPC86751.1 FAD-dependent oxidoreductase [Mesorhizobium sp. NBSH29]
MRDTLNENHPVAIIGGGPVGLAAAAHLIKRGIPVKLYEAGDGAGASLRDWGHVRVFTPWRYCVDSTARQLLEATGWQMPDPEKFPTADELVAQYLASLAALPALASAIETGARVAAVSRWGADKVVTKGRAEKPFMLVVETAKGTRRDSARAVIDASGTWRTPNPLGASGLPAEGELALGERIAYGIPDVLVRDRALYAGRTTLVAGAGHSAANALLDLVALGKTEPDTHVIWLTRSTNLDRVFGGGGADALPARGELGSEIRDLVEGGKAKLVSGFAVTEIVKQDGRLMISGQTAQGMQTVGPVDRIIAATGQRPDLSLTRELRLDLDPLLESVKALGPLIDPNEHSCGDVPPHGHRELSHPEPGFYTVGIKSYGRAPTFLLLTGYEQVRSIAAALAGDMVAADNVQLELPQTGVCTVPPSLASSISGGCCGGPAPAEIEACCVADADAKAVGKSGCGCSVAA